MKQYLIFILMLCSASVSAQDVIVKKDGSTIVCRVVELTSSEIVYKRWSDLNGSNYIMNRSDASSINYQDGKKVSLSESFNLYQPNNQNDGNRQYNDKTLLALDDKADEPYRKIRNLKRIGWIGGAALVAMGYAGNWTFFEGVEGIGVAMIVGGLVWTPTCLLIANYQKKQMQKYNNLSLYQYDLKINNGSSLSIGADFLSGQSVHENTIGLGLRYNF